MGMSERERHIKVLEQFLHDYQEWGEDLELGEAVKYAISSLKTDLKYDLMYEGEEIYTKAEVITMLTELKKEIEKKKFLESSCSFLDTTEEVNYAVYLDDLTELIQQKINALKGNEDAGE